MNNTYIDGHWSIEVFDYLHCRYYYSYLPSHNPANHKIRNIQIINSHEKLVNKFHFQSSFDHVCKNLTTSGWTFQETFMSELN